MGFEHTTKAFDGDLQDLTRLVAEMGGLAERQIVDSVDALIRRDVALGARVVAAGRSSMEVAVELYAEDRAGQGSHLATSGRFICVAVDPTGKPRSL